MKIHAKLQRLLETSTQQPRHSTIFNQKKSNCDDQHCPNKIKDNNR